MRTLGPQIWNIYQDPEQMPRLLVNHARQIDYKFIMKNENFLNYSPRLLMSCFEPLKLKDTINIFRDKIQKTDIFDLSKFIIENGHQVLQDLIIRSLNENVINNEEGKKQFVNFMSKLENEEKQEILQIIKDITPKTYEKLIMETDLKLIDRQDILTKALSSQKIFKKPRI